MVTFIRFIFLVSILLSVECIPQTEIKINIGQLYGRWKCVKTDYRGYESLSFNQAEKIRKSILNIDSCRIFYDSIDFIGVCEYSKFCISSYDTSGYSGLIIDLLYSKEELSKMLEFTPAYDNCERSCFNDCSQFFLKQDTLIHICGGYTYFLKKETN